jgi:hypothetical protein
MHGVIYDEGHQFEAAIGFEMEEFETATLFVGWLIKDVTGQLTAAPRHGEPRTFMMQWLAVTDPLGIAQDPECGYGQPRGFVS